jgi:hypothetical protein
MERPTQETKEETMMSENNYTPGPWNAQCVGVTGDRPVGDSGLRYWCIEQKLGEDEAYRGGICNVHSAEHIGGISIE